MSRKKIKRAKKKLPSKHKQLLFYVMLPLIGLAVVLAYLGQQWYFSTKADEVKYIVLYPKPDIARPNLQLRTLPVIAVRPKPTKKPQPSGTPQSLPPAKSSPPDSSGNSSAPALPGLGGNICPLDDLKPAGSSCQCIDNNAVACPAQPGSNGAANCDILDVPIQLPPGSGKWYCAKVGKAGILEPNPPPPPPGCFAACIAKPIVYLYPESPTYVDVSVTTPGEIFVSDPLYPEGGWKDVLAHPDGTLFYKGKKYPELFYESTVVTEIPMPEKGYVVAVKDLYPKMSEVITRLGLQGREHDEFLEFWVPVLKQQRAPFIFFSILPPDVKDSVDRLNISPEPDTRIEIIAYFKALQKPISVQPLDLPETPPARIGFTEVEWGGTIAK